MADAQAQTKADGLISADEGLNVVGYTLKRLIAGKMDSKDAQDVLKTYTPDTIDFATDAPNMAERNRRKGVLHSFGIAHAMADKAQQIRHKTELLDGQIKAVKALKSTKSNDTTLANLQIVRTQYRDMLDNLAGLNNERLVADSSQLDAVEEGFHEFKASLSAFVQQTSDHSPSYKFDNEADGLNSTSFRAKGMQTGSMGARSSAMILMGTMKLENMSKNEQLYIWQQIELRGGLNTGLMRRINVAGAHESLIFAGLADGDAKLSQRKKDILDRYIEDNEEFLRKLWEVNKKLNDVEEAVDQGLDRIDDEIDHLQREYPEKAEKEIKNLKQNRDKLVDFKEILAKMRRTMQNITPDIDLEEMGRKIADVSQKVGRTMKNAGETLGRVAARGWSKLGTAADEAWRKIQAAFPFLNTTTPPPPPPP